MRLDSVRKEGHLSNPIFAKHRSILNHFNELNDLGTKNCRLVYYCAPVLVPLSSLVRIYVCILVCDYVDLNV